MATPQESYITVDVLIYGILFVLAFFLSIVLFLYAVIQILKKNQDYYLLGTTFFLLVTLACKSFKTSLKPVNPCLFWSDW